MLGIVLFPERGTLVPKGETMDEDTEDKIIDFIRLYQQAYPGLSPTYRQIAGQLGLASISTVFYHLDHLEKRGKLERSRGGVQRQGMTLSDTVVVTEIDAVKLGLDWSKLQMIRQVNRQLLRDKLNGR